MKKEQHVYKVIEVNGVIAVHVLSRKATLEQLQQWTGSGYIEIVRLLPKQWVVVNEEGAVNGMPPNPHVSFNGAPLHGPVVFLPNGCQS